VPSAPRTRSWLVFEVTVVTKVSFRRFSPQIISAAADGASRKGQSRASARSGDARPRFFISPFSSRMRSMLWRSPSPALRPEVFIEPCLPTLARTAPFAQLEMLTAERP
jgi:hypothetical protein